MSTRVALVGVLVAGVFALTACSGADQGSDDVNVGVSTGKSDPNGLLLSGSTLTTTTTTCSTCTTTTTTTTKNPVTYSKCAPVGVDRYGSGKEVFLGNARVAKLVKNQTTGAYEVPCVYIEKASRATCTVNSTSAPWFRGKDGNIYMKTGYRVDLNGTPDGDYVISAAVGSDNTVPCVDPAARDTAGTSVSTELAAACVVETLNVATNATGLQVDNYATLKVCTSSNPHPDNAELIKGTTYCYIGRGAALNDINGSERDEYGNYYPDENHCHVAWISGVEAPAAKRPATKSFPAPGVVNTASPILWRAVANSISIAN